MDKWVCLLMLLVVSGVLANPAQSDSKKPGVQAQKPYGPWARTPETIKFTADRRAVRLNGQLPDSDKATVTVEAQAIIYNPPLVIADFTQWKKALDPDVAFIVRYHQALADSNPEQISAMWHSAEREAKKKLLQRKEVFAALKKHYRSDKSLKIFGILFQANTNSVLLELGGAIVGFHIIKENGEAKLTDNPDDDLEVAIVEASLRKR